MKVTILMCSKLSCIKTTILLCLIVPRVSGIWMGMCSGWLSLLSGVWFWRGRLVIEGDLTAGDQNHLESLLMCLVLHCQSSGTSAGAFPCDLSGWPGPPQCGGVCDGWTPLLLSGAIKVGVLKNYFKQSCLIFDLFSSFTARFLWHANWFSVSP